ncbi:hypothetical protein RclHR1_12830003 [Rhizophagus clarus]|uniref:Uncharacterized protein n=1 Tax=Rhizophagus clarus TaxID=94130 RepID=A0A2Z6QD21_9GLOM|nr:hypothetical protein RclHR1_12830003 [Rhizophagus clarus]
MGFTDNPNTRKQDDDVPEKSDRNNVLEVQILDQYPNLNIKCSSENFDYYGITDETSCGNYICPLCKLGHNDEEIESIYKARFYFIKCEQHKIEIVAQSYQLFEDDNLSEKF